MTEPDPRVLLAYTRTHLANERTYAAWLRTGLAVAAVGFAAAEFIVGHGGGVGQGISVALVLAGALIVLFGGYSYRRVCRQLGREGAPAATLSSWLVGAASLALAALILSALFLL